MQRLVFRYKNIKLLSMRLSFYRLIAVATLGMAIN